MPLIVALAVGLPACFGQNAIDVNEVVPPRATVHAEVHAGGPAGPERDIAYVVVSGVENQNQRPPQAMAAALKSRGYSISPSDSSNTWWDFVADDGYEVFIGAYSSFLQSAGTEVYSSEIAQRLQAKAGAPEEDHVVLVVERTE